LVRFGTAVYFQIFLNAGMQEHEKQPKEIRFIQPDQNSWNLEKDVHVWKFLVIQTDLSLLTGHEKALANQFRFDEDKCRFAVGRQALRHLLSKYLNVKPLDIGIDHKDLKKPVISYPLTDIHFNISHSGEWVLIGISRKELGIDIEKIDPEFQYSDLLQEHFSEAEKSFISRAANPLLAFLYLWTRKEALTKAWGTGLQENLKTVSVLSDYSSVDLQQKSWKLESFHFSDFYQSALAHLCDTENIIYFDGNVLF
jgi:4'-phosphopantetheinyl transferase